MEEKVFFYIDKLGIQQGPRTVRQLEFEYTITPQTMVWTQGMSDWKPAGEVEELNGLCYTQQPPVTNYQPQQEPKVVSVPEENPPAPHSWLVESIICTALCCLVFGVVGIVYAAKVDNLWAAKRYEEAKSAANTAKIMVLISAGSALLIGLAYLLFIFVFTTDGSVGLFL